MKRLKLWFGRHKALAVILALLLIVAGAVPSIRLFIGLLIGAMVYLCLIRYLAKQLVRRPIWHQIIAHLFILFILVVLPLRLSGLYFQEPWAVVRLLCLYFIVMGIGLGIKTAVAWFKQWRFNHQLQRDSQKPEAKMQD